MCRIKFIFISLFILILMVSYANNSFVYISLKGEDKIVIYEVNNETGQLEYISSQIVSGQPASIAIHPSKKYLYVARRSDKKVSSYTIDSLTGKLSFINDIDAIDNPVYISTDKSGEYLLSAYFGASKIAVYSISDDGKLKAGALQEVATGTNPHAILTDPSNQFLYVSNMTGNRMEQYSFDETTGKFSGLEPFAIIPKNNDCPRHFILNNVGDKMYVVNEIGCSITVYNRDLSSGQLSDIQTISTLPKGFTDTNKCADIHISPNGKYLYASNRGHESIAAFEIESTTGKISLINIYPTVNTPREFDLDPTGQYLYAAGESSDDVACYKIQENGVLDSISTIMVGKTPSWVSTVTFNEFQTGNLSLEKQQIQIYPNPFDTSFYVENINNNIEIELFDMSGKRMDYTYLLNGNIGEIYPMDYASDASYIIVTCTDGNLFQSHLLYHKSE